jgi:PRTRC genetic system protein B
MLKVKTSSSEQEFALSQAILLYTGPNGGYASVHQVQHDPNGGAPVILPGVPVTKGGVIESLKRLMPKDTDKRTLFAPNLLAKGLDYMAWWVPPRTCPVWFKSPELGERTAPVPHPGLVFIVVGGRRFIYAVKGKNRPTTETELFQAPYFNTYSSGSVCEGSTRLPRGEAAQNPVAWEESFFRSFFTHPNIHEKNKLVKFKDGVFAFWRDMLDGKFTTFPDMVLVKTGKTLESAFKSAMGG